jgi:aspartyl-tRNA(Asn)/glutamyl-tRNA(Gln) amidotransferase subunit A
MTAIDLTRSDIVGLSELIRNKEISPLELIKACLDRIQATNPQTNAFLTILEEEALQAAQRAEDEIKRGDYIGPLHGIPFAAKDLYCTSGVKTTCASKVLEDYVPDYNATVITRLLEAGAILIGKAHMHEFAFGTTNLNAHYGHARNPWDHSRITGGSSGGSGAAVASSCVPLALGSDTGGSIRIPAALCGTVGLKPTFGRVSKHGLFPVAWSLDHAGPLTKTAADAAITLCAMAGHDPKDPSSIDEPVPDYYAALAGDIQGIKIGVPDTHYFEEIAPEVKAAVEETFSGFESIGALVRPVHIPELEEASAATLLILSSEAASAWEKYHKTIPEEIGEDVRTRLDTGALHLATHYINAQRFRRRMQKRFVQLFEEVDLLLTPGVSVTAPKIEDATVSIDGEEIPVNAALTRCTRIYNLLGIPSVGVPCGLSADGLPIGIQIAGKPFDEGTVLRVAHAYQTELFSIRDWPQ